MQDLVGAINRALRARGWSARQASVEAVGNSELIRDIRRGRLPSVERLQRLCEVLDLEFYVGPRREWGSIDESRLAEAVSSTEHALAKIETVVDPDAKATIVAAIYELLDRERDAATATRVMRVIEGLTSGRVGAGATGEESE